MTKSYGDITVTTSIILSLQWQESQNITVWRTIAEETCMPLALGLVILAVGSFKLIRVVAYAGSTLLTFSASGTRFICFLCFALVDVCSWTTPWTITERTHPGEETWQQTILNQKVWNHFHMCHPGKFFKIISIEWIIKSHQPPWHRHFPHTRSPFPLHRGALRMGDWRRVKDSLLKMICHKEMWL